MSATVTAIDKSPTTSIGYIIRNDGGWGIKAVRDSSIALLVKTSNDLADFTNPITAFEDINSPADMESIIEGYQSAESSQQTVQRVGVTAPSLVTEVTLTVQGTSSTKLSDAEVVVRAEDGTYTTVANNEDGTYTFTLPRASTATVAISAEGYQANSVSITATNTATATYTQTVSITAAG